MFEEYQVVSVDIVECSAMTVVTGDEVSELTGGLVGLVNHFVNFDFCSKLRYHWRFEQKRSRV